MTHNFRKSKLADALGIDDIEPLDLSKSSEILPPVSTAVTTSDAEADYNTTRNTMRNLIDKGTKAIDELYDIARASEHPRSFEVLANLIKTTSDVSKDLYDLQKKTKDLKDDKSKPSQENITVEKAVFVGSTAELLKKIKEEK